MNQTSKEKLPALPEKTEEEKEYALELLKALYKFYPNPQCALNHRSPFELLCATILSAQCTDVRVNKVTPDLFEAYPTPEMMGEAPLADLQELVRSTGFYKNKSKALKQSSQMVVNDYGGEVPASMKELLKLRGVARKTANVVLGNAFDINMGVVVDTHVRRLSNRFGLTEHEKNVKKIEKRFNGAFSTRRVDQSFASFHSPRTKCLQSPYFGTARSSCL